METYRIVYRDGMISEARDWDETLRFIEIACCGLGESSNGVPYPLRPAFVVAESMIREAMKKSGLEAVQLDLNPARNVRARPRRPVRVRGLERYDSPTERTEVAESVVMAPAEIEMDESQIEKVERTLNRAGTSLQEVLSIDRPHFR